MMKGIKASMAALADKIIHPDGRKGAELADGGHGHVEKSIVGLLGGLWLRYCLSYI